MEIIAADVGTRGLVIRANPDAAPLLWKGKHRGEVMREATPAFGPCMKRATGIHRRALAEPSPEGIQRLFIDV